MTAQNQLIERLPRKDRTSLLAAGETVHLVLGEVLLEPGQSARHVWFPIEGFISMLVPLNGKPALEVGMVGREGMLGAHLALGVATVPLHALVQGAGPALRLRAGAFRGEMADSAALRRIIDRYVYVLMVQLTGSAACLRFHAIGPRLARWLLMSQDRAGTNCFRLTHEFMAYMLGVRREGITAAASALQRRGLIEYRRGAMTVLDRPGLEAEACDCYANDSRAYAAQFS